MEDYDDNEINESEHSRLISAVSKLDKTQHIKVPTRSEPTNLNSEFNLIKSSNKLDLTNVVKVLENTTNHVQIGKKLKKTHDVSKVLPKPLEKPQIERIKRATGYEAAKKKVGRWDPVVARSRTVDYVSFPIKHASQKMQPTKDFLSKLKLKSPLELELDQVDPPAPVVADEDDQEQTYPMTYEEMVEQRQHLAKMRAQQSFKAAKAKRQSKIKSKKYHRILKKEKLKQQLKEFEEFQKTDPEEALKKLETLEKSRALERHTLRHKNTGKWAKNKLVRAKYDKEVRQELAEQLAVGRGLTAKAGNNESTDDEANDNEGIADIILAQDPSNPWMLKRSDKSNIDAEFDFGYKKYVQSRKNKADESDTESEQETTKKDDFNKKEPSDDVQVSNGSESATYKDILENMILGQSENKIGLSEKKNHKEKNKQTTLVSKSGIKKKKDTVKPKLKKVISTKIIATSSWVVESADEKDRNPKTEADITEGFESLEDKFKGKVDIKLKKLRDQVNKLEKRKKWIEAKEDKIEKDNLEYLSFKNRKLKAIIDEQLNETSSKTPGNKKKEDTLQKLTPTTQTNQPSKTEANIDPSRFIQVKPKFLNSIIPEGENDLDQLDDDEQVVPKVNIEEVFEEDDVVASFRQEKEEEANKDQPQDIDLSLPGWGSWGGKGVKAPKKRKNRFILKAPPKVPRRDENKGDIIIKEYKDPKLAVHKVSDVPFPFTSVKEYEASIRAPIGNTFIPEKAHKKLIRPSVITKAGTIIEPMDEEELLVPRNRAFKNENVIKVLAKK
ncbi:hypothetical protein JYU34_001581 [Plutella xylostella]|uniref:U3 small nucleolar RNA-associated protein 14 homolog A n=1 Tax=Plutella xylostella TaxID=51655 RepID=A0ABQ7R4C3_PLUXY|nr:hypothetical protein JYU34_001581 [Plutella xylostella]